MLELLVSAREHTAGLIVMRDILVPLPSSTPYILSKTSNPAGRQLPPFSDLSPSSELGSYLPEIASDPRLEGSINAPPMTPRDVEIVFSNVAELAYFSETLLERLGRALDFMSEENKIRWNDGQHGDITPDGAHYEDRPTEKENRETSQRARGPRSVHSIFRRRCCAMGEKRVHDVRTVKRLES